MSEIVKTIKCRAAIHCRVYIYIYTVVYTIEPFFASFSSFPFFFLFLRIYSWLFLAWLFTLDRAAREPLPPSRRRTLLRL